MSRGIHISYIFFIDLHDCSKTLFITTTGESYSDPIVHYAVHIHVGQSGCEWTVSSGLFGNIMLFKIGHVYIIMYKAIVHF